MIQFPSVRKRSFRSLTRFTYRKLDCRSLLDDTPRKKHKKEEKTIEKYFTFFLFRLNPRVGTNDIFANLNYNPCYLEKIHFFFIPASPTIHFRLNRCTHWSSQIIHKFKDRQDVQQRARSDWCIAASWIGIELTIPPPSCPLVTFESSGAVSALQDVQLDAWRVQETSSPLFSAYNPPLHATRLPVSSPSFVHGSLACSGGGWGSWFQHNEQASMARLLLSRSPFPPLLFSSLFLSLLFPFLVRLAGRFFEFRGEESKTEAR